MPTKIFIWDELSDNVLFETDENNNVQVAYTHRPEKFGEVLYHKTGPRYTYYHYDGNGSTNKLTGDAATVIKTYIFTGHGELVASSGTGSTPFAYKGAAGYYTNPVTNDIYVRARTYEPTTGRWLSKDPLGFVDGPNLYGAYFVPNDIDSLNIKNNPTTTAFQSIGVSSVTMNYSCWIWACGQAWGTCTCKAHLPPLVLRFKMNACILPSCYGSIVAAEAFGGNAALQPGAIQSALQACIIAERDPFKTGVNVSLVSCQCT